MYISFDKLSDQARIWIYQADRVLSDSELLEIQALGKEFVNQWDSHGSEVEGSCILKHGYFLILASNEQKNSPSGCSIDKSVGFIRSLGQKFGIDFFVRSTVIFQDQTELKAVKLDEIPSQIMSGALQPETLVFDNLIQTKEALKDWQKPAHQTWLKRYF